MSAPQDSGPSEAGVARAALVTGGNRGIGLAVARRLRRDGHRVAVTYRSEPPPAADRGSLACVHCDVTDSESVKAAVDEAARRVGAIEILVCNAGITRDALSVRMSEEDFTAVLDANLTGAFRVAKQSLKGMLRRRWGRIVLISSVSGIAGQPGQANYAASKAGMIGLARSLAKEVASRSITVNVVAPGPVDTDMLASLPTARLDDLVSRVPLQRVGTPNELAAAVAFLASEDAGYVSGIVMPVDGGLSVA